MHALRITQKALPLVIALSSCMIQNAEGQYDWSKHLSPTPTGFELSRFGTWDLEVIPLRGMIDRSFYESDIFKGSRVRKIVETTRSAADGTGASTTFRHSTSHLDRSGRITRIEYADPLTKKVIQRETFAYDRDGRLVSWRRARPPSEASVASVARTVFPGRRPYGMSQTFSYDASGGLREWRACTIAKDQRLELCEEDYLLLDSRQRIIAFGAGGTHYMIARDPSGNAVSIEIRGTDGAVDEAFSVTLEDRTVSENPARDTLDVANLGWLDEDGRMIQYRVSLPDAPEYYWTATWAYDRKGRPLKVTKGFDTFEFRYDAAGRLIGVDQSRKPESVFRTYNSQGQLHSQEPPLFYGRLNAGLAGKEQYTYDSRGYLKTISVQNASGQSVAETEISYLGRGTN